MANNTSVRVSLNVEANVDSAKKSLNSLQDSLRKIQTERIEIIDDIALKNASKAALDLQRHLQASVNVDTGKIDLTRFSQSLKQSGQNLEHFYNSFKAMGSTGEQAFLNLSKSIALSDAGMIRLGGRLDDFLKTLGKTAKWQISSNIFTGFEKVLSSAYGYAKDLNRSLNEIRIVSGQNTDQMAKFAKEANRAAKALSSSTTDYTDAALIYYQQGLQEEEIAERTEVTIKMANAAGESAQTVSDQMTAVWNNFYDGSKSLEYYADVMTALGAATASSTDEISDGLEKFAATAGTVGLSYEYATTALATVTAETRQSADVVGTAFRTLFTRIQGLQLGETAEDGTTLNKYSSALDAVGVNIKNTSGELKGMDQILAELGDRWGKLSQDTKIALAQTVGGARQYTTLISLMDNWDKFQKNLDVTNTAEGTLQEQADIYAESWEAASERVGTAAEEIYSKLLNDEFFIDILNGFEKFLGGISNVVDGLGGMKGMLLAISTIIMRRYAKEIPGVLSNIGANLGLITGKAREESQKIQKQNASFLTQMVGEKGISRTATERAKTLEVVNSINMELASKWDQLTEKERQFYQQKIDLVQTIGEEIQETAKEIVALEKTIDNQRTQIPNAINNSKAGRKKIGKANAAFQTFETDLITLGTIETLRTSLGGQDRSWNDNPILSGREGQQEFNRRKKVMSSYLDDLKSKKIKGLGENVLKGYRSQIESASQDKIEEIWKNISSEIDKAFENAINETSKKIEDAKTDLKQIPGMAEQIDEFATNVVYKAQLEASNEINRNTQTGLKDEDIPHITKNAEVYSYYASQVMQVAFSYQSASQALKVWKDENASLSDKLISTATSVGSIAGFIGQLGSESNIKQLANMAMGLKKFNDIGTDSQNVLREMANNGAMTAGGMSALAKTLGPLALKFAGIAAIAVVVGFAIKGLINLVNEEKNAAENAIKTHNEAKQNYKELREEINRVKDSLENYESSIKTIDSLVKGTQAWREQVSALNIEMLDLLEKYDFLREYITNENGILVLSDKGKIELNKQLEKDLLEAEQTVYTTGMAKASLSNEQIYSQAFSTQSKVSYTGLNGEIVKTDGVVFTSKEDLKNIYDTINSLALTEFDLTDPKKIAEYFGYGEESDKNTALIKIIQENSENLIKNAEALQLNNEELKLNTSQLGYSYLDDNDKESKYASQLANSLGRRMNELVEEELDKEDGIGSYKRWKVISELKKLDQYSDVERVVGEDKLSYTDENGDPQELTYNEAKYILAYDKIENSLNDVTSELGKFKTALQTFFNTDGSLTKNKNLDNYLFNDADGIENGIDFSKASDDELNAYINFNGTINDDDANTVFGVTGEALKDEIVKSAREEQQRRSRQEEQNRENFYDLYLSKLSSEEQKNYLYTDEVSGVQSIDYGKFADSAIFKVYEKLKEAGIDPEEFFGKIDLSKGMPDISDFNSWNKLADSAIEELKQEEKVLANQAKLAERIESFKLDEEEIKSYTKHLQEMALSSDAVADGLEKDAVAAEQVAIAGTRLNRGLDTVQEKFSEWQRIFNSEDITSSEYAKAIEEYRNAMADILNMSSNDISEEFLVTYFKEVEKAANGDTEAVELLRNKIIELQTEKIILELNDDQISEDLPNAIGLVQTFLKDNPLKVGAEVKEEEFIKIFNELIRNSTLTATEISRILGSAFELNLNDDNTIDSMTYLGNTKNLFNFSNTKLGGAKASSSKDKIKKLDEELDRYHEIKEVLEDINREQDRLGKAKDRAWGGKRIALIQQEIDKTEEAIAAQEEYIRQIEAQAGTSKGAIAAYGATFDEYGRITNYSELIAQQVAIYNAAIASGVDSQIEAAEKAYEAFKKALSDYEETADLLEEEYENLIDKQNELYDKLLEKVEYTVEVKLEVSERDQAYLDYLIEKGSNNAYDTAENIALIGDKTQDLINDGNTYRRGIEDIFRNHGKDDDFIQQWLAGKISNEDLINLGFTEQEIAKLQEYADGLLEVNTKLMEIKNTITEMVLSAFQDLAGEMQRNIDKISHLKDVMNSYKNIIDLVGKQNLGIDSKFMGDINQAIFDTSANSLRANKAKLDATREAYQDVYEMAQTANAKWQEAQANSENYTEAELDELEATAAAFDDALSEMETEVQNAEEAFLTSWQDALQAAADMYNQAVENAISDFEDTMSAGFGSLDSLLEVYEQSKTISSQYLEEYQQIYELSKLTRNINNSIDDTDNIAGKEKLRDLLLEIEEMQRNGVEMSQYDLEYLQKRYDLRLAEIALEDAQNAKSQVRMARDAEGNWNYTYTADDSAVDNARQNYEDKLYALQELSSEYLDTIGQQWIQAEKEWAQALQAIYLDTTLTEEERKNRIEQTNEFYRQRFQYFTGEIEKATGNNQKLYERDWMAYSAKTGYQIADNESFQMSFNDTILGTIYDGVNSIEELHSKLNTAMGAPGIEGSLLGTLDSSYKQWSANVDFAMDMAGTSVGEFAGAVEDMADTVATDGEQAAEDVEDQGKRVGETFDGIKTAVNNWLTAYSKSIASAISENEKLVTSIQKIAKAYLEALDAQDSFNGSNMGSDNPGNSTPKPSDPPSDDDDDSGSNDRMCLFTIIALDPQDAAVYIDDEPLNSKSVKQNTIIRWKVSKPGYRTKQGSHKMVTDYLERVTLDKNSSNSIQSGGYDKNGIWIPAYDTGGYTGEWGSSGRIAMLHEKELVLNPPDTKNMLQTIGIVREIARSIDLNAISASQGLGGLIAQTLHSSNQTLDQQVTIYAEFPNAVDHTEIEEAFNTLVNTASQYANRKL